MNKLLAIITAIFLSFCAQSSVVPEEFKNVHDVFTKKSEHLSPLPGFIWAIGGVAENLDELGSFKDNPNILLMRKLFHRVDPATYRETRFESNPASHLKLLSIGKIAAILETLKTTFPAEQIALLATKRPELLAKNAELKSFLENLKEVITGDLKGNLAEKSVLAKPVQQLALLLVRALLNSNDDISVFKVLGALVYFKANNKEHLHDYYKGLSDDGARDHFFNDPEFLTEKQKWVADRFAEIDEDTTLDQIPTYEQKAFFLVKKIAKSWVQSYLTGFKTAYLSTGFGFPDCGENSLLNLYRMIFAKKDSTIDLELLEKINSHQKIKAFFYKFNTLSLLRSDDARNAWADLTSNIPTLCSASAYYDRESYCGKTRQADEHCEMNPGFSTMNQFIKEIQGQTFEELINEVNKHTDDNFSFTKQLDNENKLGDIKINTKDRGDFELVFQPGHFIFRAIAKPKADYKTLDILLREEQPVKDLIALVPFSWEKNPRLKRSDSLDFRYSQWLNIINNDDDIVLFLEMMISTTQPSDYFNILNRVQNLDSKLRIRNAVLEAAEEEETKTAYINWLVKAKQESILEREIFGRTALHDAAATKENGAKVIGLILEHMSQPAIDKRDKTGRTALHSAVNASQSEAVIDMLLLKMSQDAIEAVDERGDTALDLAYFKHLNTIRKKLLEKMRPANIRLLGTAVKDSDSEFVELLVNKMTPDAIDSARLYGEPILQYATRSKPLEIVKLLTRKMSKKTLEAKGFSEETALDIALDIARKDNDYGKANHLIEVLGPETLKNSLLRSEIKKSDTKLVEFLLNRMTREEIEAKDGSGTVLHLAALLGNVDIVKLLTEKMTQEAIEAKNDSGKTALFFASNDGNKKIAELLAQKMSCNAIQAKDAFGYTALRVAQTNKHQSVVELLEAIARNKTTISPAECLVP